MTGMQREKDINVQFERRRDCHRHMISKHLSEAGPRPSGTVFVSGIK